MQKYVHVERPVQEIKPLLEGKFGMKLLGVYLTMTDSGVYNWHMYQMGQNRATIEEPLKQTLTHQEKLDPTVYFSGEEDFVKTLLADLI